MYGMYVCIYGLIDVCTGTDLVSLEIEGENVSRVAAIHLQLRLARVVRHGNVISIH